MRHISKPGPRPLLSLLGLIAAGALAAKGMQEYLEYGNWALLMTAAAVVVAVVLRRTVYR